jgi:ribosomal-protein-alanine N-acetyltransferase
MSAQLRPEASLRPMTVSDLDAVLAIENLAYAFPWSRGNFVDSLAAGYLAEVWSEPGAGIVGYFVALAGVDELHLLNLTVAPAWQGRGLAQRLLDVLEQRCHERSLATLWLEARESNARARALYRRRGFAEVGRRRGYYPAPFSRREDAIVMSARVLPPPEDALD